MPQNQQWSTAQYGIWMCPHCRERILQKHKADTEKLAEASALALEIEKIGDQDLLNRANLVVNTF